MSNFYQEHSKAIVGSVLVLVVATISALALSSKLVSGWNRPKVDLNNLTGTWQGKGGSGNQYDLTLEITGDRRVSVPIHPRSPSDVITTDFINDYSITAALNVSGAPAPCSYNNIILNGAWNGSQLRMNGYAGRKGAQVDGNSILWQDSDDFHFSASFNDNAMDGLFSSVSKKPGCPALDIPFHLSLIKASGLPQSTLAFLNKPSPLYQLAIGKDDTNPADPQVPFVGCPAYGQSGPADAPTGTSKTVPVVPEAAARLAYYQAEGGIGVLAPRGWHCFATYGSDGTSLFVSPDPIDGSLAFSEQWQGFSNSAIQVSEIDGDTSGRFEVAKTIARVFPASISFAQGVILEGVEPAGAFPFGPYPGDSLTYIDNGAVEYETAANQEGLGTHSRLKKNRSPIDGVVILNGQGPKLVQLSMRLPNGAGDLLPVVMRELEYDAIKHMKHPAR